MLNTAKDQGVGGVKRTQDKYFHPDARVSITSTNLRLRKTANYRVLFVPSYILVLAI